MTAQPMRISEEGSTSLFTGDMGIQMAAVGDDVIYRRKGGVVYLMLNTFEESEE